MADTKTAAERSFGSDNHASVHPQILASIVAANTNHAASYGIDPWSEQLGQEIRRLFGDNAEGFLVFNGTGANVSALKALVRSHQSVVCTDIAHIAMDECGAPEAIVGCKLLPVPHYQGKLTLPWLEKIWLRRGDQHASQIGAISITQPTELGTCYSLSELQHLATWAKAHGLKLHMDGARFAGAAQFLQTSLRQLSADLGVDILSLGGTKNGLLAGEIVVIFDPQLARDFRYIRKQCLQLPSKTRFMAAQFLTYFADELWRTLAKASHEMALDLAQQLRERTGISADYPVEGNAVFVTLPQKWIKPLKAQSFFYVWDERSFQCRLMTSWDTDGKDITSFVDKVAELKLSKI